MECDSEQKLTLLYLKSFYFKRKAILINNENDWLIFKTTRNKVNIELRNAKKDYYSSKIADQKFNPKKAWKSINSLLGRQNKPTVINELRVGENNFTNHEDIAEGFNEYFSNIGPNLARFFKLQF